MLSLICQNTLIGNYLILTKTLLKTILTKTPTSAVPIPCVIGSISWLKTLQIWCYFSFDSLTGLIKWPGLHSRHKCTIHFISSISFSKWNPNLKNLCHGNKNVFSYLSILVCIFTIYIYILAVSPRHARGRNGHYENLSLRKSHNIP